jgi:exosortase/archaeosortase family protein
MALGMLAVLFAYYFRKNRMEQIIIVLSAIPIAIFVNAFRVALTGFLADRMGSAAANGLIHMTEGVFTFGLAFGLLLIEAWLLAMFSPRDWWRSRRTVKQ